jgi:putative endonuclease
VKYYYVYILQSLVDDSYYIGYTESIEKRLYEHNNGLSKYTSGKMPWSLVYSEAFDSKTVALKREKFLKKQKNSQFYQRLINDAKKN